MAYYIHFVDYINCSTDIKEKIARIDAIIKALEDAELKGALNADVEEYSLDDGQTRIKKTFRNIKDIEDAILALQRRKTQLQNKCVGYRYNLQDGNVRNC